MTPQRLPTILGILLCVFAVVGCQQKATQKESHAAPEEPTVWICIFGSEGGFTGGGSGYEIHASGQVLAWNQTTPQHPLEKQAIGQATPEQLETLSIALHAPGLQSIEYQQSGNLTSFLEMQRPGHKHRWSWPAGGRGDGAPKIPALVRDCFEAAQLIARKGLSFREPF